MINSAYIDRNRKLNEQGKSYHPTVTEPFYYEVDYHWLSGAISQVRCDQMASAIEWLKERLEDKGTFRIRATNGHTTVDVTNSVRDMLGLEINVPSYQTRS